MASSTMSVRELKQALSELGVNHAHCKEKCELVELLAEASSLKSKAPEMELCRMTPAELLACCEAAHVRGELRTGSKFNSDTWDPPYKCSLPFMATNEEIARMEGLYVAFFSDKELWRLLMDVIVNKQPDGAAAALYFLDYPNLIYNSRHNSSGLTATDVLCKSPSENKKNDAHRQVLQDHYQLSGVLKSTTTNVELIRHCRALLGDSSAHDKVVESAISLLCAAMMTGGASKSKRGPDVIGGTNVQKALEKTFVAISKVVSRPGLGRTYMTKAFELWVLVQSAFDSRLQWAEHPAARAYTMACDRHKDWMGEQGYIPFRVLFTPNRELDAFLKLHGLEDQYTPEVCEQTPEEELHLSKLLKEQRKEELVMNGGAQLCAAEDCDELASNKCSRCALTWYCSAECQRKHWKKHKKECKAPRSDAEAGKSTAKDVAELTGKYAEKLGSKDDDTWSARAASQLSGLLGLPLKDPSP